MTLDFLNLDPIAFQVGPLVIRWYALAYLAGFLLGWRYALYLAGRAEGYKNTLPTKLQIDDFLPWAVGGVILGGRFGYVLFYQFESYMQHPLDILKIWQGGMSFHGGTLGVIAAMVIYARRHKIPLLRLTDIIATVVPIGLFFGRIANFVNGELFGRVTESSLGVIFPHGGPLPRHPSQLYESALEGLVLFIVLAALAHKEKIRNKPGLITGVFLIGYALSRMFVELFREPDRHLGFIVGQMTMGQILSVPMVLGGIYLIWRALKIQK